MAKSNIIYNVEDKPSWSRTLVFALQQLLAILAATIAVPAIINNGVADAHMSQSAALFGAGAGTLIYLVFTKFKSPVFLGSSFAFIGSMFAAFSGALSIAAGYLGLIIGAILAGLVYVAISIAVKFAGTDWINKIMPAVVIGPIVAIIGLSLASNAVGDMVGGIAYDADLGAYPMNWHGVASLFCGGVTLLTTILFSVYGKKLLKMIPFILGILAGYLCALIFTGIGYAAGHEGLKLINFAAFNPKTWEWLPNFAFVKAFDGGFKDFNFGYLGTLAVAYVPVAFVVFAEHLADHKNLSSIIDRDLLKEPGLNRTLLGDGVGSMVGAFFGGCPNTTYGESIGTVAISGNASIRTIFVTACMAIVLSFIAPFSTFLASIPQCVMGGVCVALYGFIAVSGLKMIKEVDLGDNKNLFVVATILILGVGNMTIAFGKVILTKVAIALIAGITINILVRVLPFGKKDEEEPVAEVAAEPAAEEPAQQQEEAPAEEAPAEEPAEENNEEAPVEENPEENPEEQPAEQPEEEASEEQPAEEPEEEAAPEAEQPAEPEQKPQNNNNGQKSGGKNKKRNK